MEKWYAIQTKPRKEFVADSALAAVSGIRTYLPTLKVDPINPRARKVRPFFPGYLFASADLDRVGPSAIRWVPGVARLLGCGDNPVPIPQSVIDGIRYRVTEVQERDPHGLGEFRHGDRVRIKAGPFEGYEGMFDTRLKGRLRVRILVEFLQRLVTAEVDVRDLEKLTPRAD
jgi:transcriptional antiterminator RfaH